MLKKLFLFFCAAVVAGGARAGWFDAEPPQIQRVYTETSVDSFMADVDDANFIPEAEFMRREDSMNYDANIDMARGTEAAIHPGVGFADKPVIVCRDFGCTKLNDRITRTFLFNSLSNMFIMNAHSRVNICEADPFNRACLQGGISFPVRAGIASALVKIPRATINNISLSTGLSKASVSITYDFMVNGIAVRCEPTAADIIVPANTNAVLSNREFACNMTSDGLTNVSLLINLDYIDLDYGILGGYYSFGLQGPTTGGGTGYALFKTEYANRGMAANSVKDAGQGAQSIKPGEYAVEPAQ
jgi:hypothetical protein